MVYHPRTLLPLILHIFKITFIARSEPLFCDFVRLFRICYPINFILSSCVYSLYMTTISSSPCIFIPLMAVIFVRVTSTDTLRMSCVNYWCFIFSVLFSFVPYFFPTNFTSKRSNHFTGFALLGIVHVFTHALISMLIAFTVVVWLSSTCSY